MRAIVTVVAKFIYPIRDAHSSFDPKFKSSVLSTVECAADKAYSFALEKAEMQID